MSDLREYVIRSDKSHGGGWAIIVLDLDRCYFSTVSDFGNYAFCWGSGPGMEFRRFLMQIHEDYLGGKLMQGWPNQYEYDHELTKQTIFEHLRQMARESFLLPRRWAAYIRERDLYRRAKADADFWCAGDFDEWYRETRLSDAYEFRGEVLNRQFQGFFRHIWPRFVELLRAELELEAKAAEPAALP